MNADKRRLKTNDLSAFIGVHRRPEFFFQHRLKPVPPLFPPFTQFFNWLSVRPVLGLEARLGEGAAARWEMDCYGAALTGFQDELHAAAKTLRPPAHTRDSVATSPSRRFVHRIQSASVVFDRN